MHDRNQRGFMSKGGIYCLVLVASLGIAYLAQGCQSHDASPDSLIPSATKGRWEWLRTTTPTRVLTPQSVGYTKELEINSDDQGAYIAFYRNDTLQRRINESSSDTAHTFVNASRSSVLIKYGGAGYINYVVVVGSDKATISLTVSELMNPYSAVADTVKSVYKNVGTRLVLYPY